MNTKLSQIATRFNNRYTSFVILLQHPFLLLIRLYWGYDFFQTGLGKLNNLERTTEFFSSLNIPFPYVNAIAAGSTELICGILLMIGFGSRYIVVPLIIILSMAYLTDDYEALSNIVSDPESFVDATPFKHLLASLMILIFGAGAFSIDAILSKIFTKRNSG